MELDLLLLGFLQPGISQVLLFTFLLNVSLNLCKFSYLKRHTGQMLNNVKNKIFPPTSQVKRIYNY